MELNMSSQGMPLARRRHGRKYGWWVRILRPRVHNFRSWLLNWTLLLTFLLHIQVHWQFLLLVRLPYCGYFFPFGLLQPLQVLTLHLGRCQHLMQIQYLRLKPSERIQSLDILNPLLLYSSFYGVNIFHLLNIAHNQSERHIWRFHLLQLNFLLHYFVSFIVEFQEIWLLVSFDLVLSNSYCLFLLL